MTRAASAKRFRRTAASTGAKLRIALRRRTLFPSLSSLALIPISARPAPPYIADAVNSALGRVTSGLLPGSASLRCLQEFAQGPIRAAIELHVCAHYQQGENMSREKTP